MDDLAPVPDPHGGQSGGKPPHSRVSRATQAQCPSPSAERSRPPRLPEFLRPLFWEYRFGSLSWEKDRSLVIGRVLEHGGLEAMRWIRRQAGDDHLREWLTEREGAGIDKRRLRFWEAVLNIPHRSVNAWLAREDRQIWDNR